jgi:hypothetical protein
VVPRRAARRMISKVKIHGARLNYARIFQWELQHFYRDAIQICIRAADKRRKIASPRRCNNCNLYFSEKLSCLVWALSLSADRALTRLVAERINYLIDVFAPRAQNKKASRCIWNFIALYARANRFGMFKGT